MRSRHEKQGGLGKEHTHSLRQVEKHQRLEEQQDTRRPGMQHHRHLPTQNSIHMLLTKTDNQPK